MDTMMQFISANWTEWLFGVITIILSGMYRQMGKRIKQEQIKNDAIAAGVESLLRESIVANFNKYQDRAYCPIYAKESIKRVYIAYHNLGGNDVATKLYEKILNMPEEPEKE